MNARIRRAGRREYATGAQACTIQIYKSARIIGAIRRALTVHTNIARKSNFENSGVIKQDYIVPWDRQVRIFSVRWNRTVKLLTNDRSEGYIKREE